MSPRVPGGGDDDRYVALTAAGVGAPWAMAPSFTVGWLLRAAALRWRLVLRAHR